MRFAFSAAGFRIPRDKEERQPHLNERTLVKIIIIIIIMIR